MNEINIQKSERIAWIDAAKGIGILLVVLGHTFNIPVWLHNWIYSFHMPLFFLLAGLIIRPIHAGGGYKRGS